MWTKQFFHSQRGITVIELLIAVSITAIVFTAILALFREGLISYDRTLTEADMQLDIRHIQNVIRQDILNSKIGTVEGTIYPTDETADTLILFTGTKASPIKITYFYDGDSLKRDEKIIVEDLSSFTIDVNENNLVTLSFIKEIESSYSNQIINKEILIQAKPRSFIE